MTTMSELADKLNSSNRLPAWIEGLKNIRESMATSGTAMAVYVTSEANRPRWMLEFDDALSAVETALEMLRNVEAREHEDAMR